MGIGAIGVTNISSTFTTKTLSKAKTNVTTLGTRSITNNGATVSNAQAKFGNSSIYFGGSPARLSCSNSSDFNFGSGDFTVEFWMYLTQAWSSSGSSQGVIGMKTNDSSTGWQIYRDGGYATKLNFRAALQNNFPTVSSPSVGVWEHWAIVRSGGTLRWYFNGVQDASQSNTTNISDVVAPLYIGFSQTWSGYMNGVYLDEVRISNIGRYTSNFSVPTNAFSYDANTKLLLQTSGSIIFDRNF